MESYTKQFIEDAIEGGWHFHTNYERQVVYTYYHEILLDPLAWQAVGKTRGWGDHYHPLTGTSVMPICWECVWHKFIDHLADGKTIEEALKEL